MTIHAVIAALCIVESGGDPTAVGDGGRALGMLQIHEAVIHDVNRIYGTNFAHTDAFVPRWARRIARLYLQHYCGAHASAERYARTWNGGPRGPKKGATLPYWRKVRAALRET